MSSQQLVRALAVGLFLGAWASAAPSAAEADPTGTWKWTTEFRDQKRETTLKLKLEDGALTGTISGRNNSESAIEEGKFEDGNVSFQLTRTRGDRKFVIKYNGKVGEKEIVGKIAFGERERDWKAERVEE